MKPVINFDMDGVLVDFEGGVHRLTGREYSDLSSEAVSKFWNDSVKDFFKTLNAIPQGIDLLRFVLMSSAFDVRVLTSTGGGKHHATIASDKAEWLSRHVAASKYTFIAVPGSSVKRSFVSSESDHLIDDWKQNVDEWTDAGGVGLHFDQSPEVLSELHNYLGRLSRRSNSRGSHA